MYFFGARITTTSILPGRYQVYLVGIDRVHVHAPGFAIFIMATLCELAHYL